MGSTSTHEHQISEDLTLNSLTVTVTVTDSKVAAFMKREYT
jgi:hypothetical protein